MSKILADAPTRVKGADSTKACEIPAGSPFGDWSDQDFADYEARLDAYYGSSARDEATADRWARSNDASPAERVFHDPPPF